MKNLLTALLATILLAIVACSSPTDADQQDEQNQQTSEYPKQVGTWLIQDLSRADWVGANKAKIGPGTLVSDTTVIDSLGDHRLFITVDTTDQHDDYFTLHFTDSSVVEGFEPGKRSEWHFPNGSAFDDGGQGIGGEYADDGSVAYIDARLGLFYGCPSETTNQEVIEFNMYYDETGLADTLLHSYHFKVDGFLNTLDIMLCD